MNMLPKLNEMIESKYLRKEDVGDEEVPVTVKGLKRVNMARDGEEPKYKWTISFNEFDRPMVLNKTNITKLGAILGDDTAGWIGNQVKLYFNPDISFGSDVVGGLRFKPMSRPARKPARPLDEDEPF